MSFAYQSDGTVGKGHSQRRHISLRVTSLPGPKQGGLLLSYHLYLIADNGV
jgi:hypothetical protein